MNDIVIDEPVVIRGYTPGGKGGYGGSSTPLHRLVRRTQRHDVAACGYQFTNGRINVRPAGRDGLPSKGQIKQYGTCRKCWPTIPWQPTTGELRDMEMAHAEGLHDGEDRRQFCPDCEAQR